MEELLSFISEETGICVDEKRHRGLISKLLDLLKKEGVVPQEYSIFLKFHPKGKELFEKAVEEIAIPETYFFRSPDHFEVLEKVIQELLKRKREVRIWSAGCSSGEEPYSIAMLILERFGFVKERFSIVGTDIRNSAISSAEKGIYCQSSMRAVPDQYYKYFERDGERYILKQEVKDMVSFSCHNLLDSSCKEKKDVIFCRNVIIYFNKKKACDAIEKLYLALEEKGFLFLGHAENLWQMTEKFKVIKFPHTFIYQKDEEEKSAGRSFEVEIPEISASLLNKLEEEHRQRERIGEDLEKKIKRLYKEAVILFKRKEQAPSLYLFDKIIEIDPGFAPAFFNRGLILADSGRYREAEDELKKATAIDPLFLEAHYLLGILYEKNEKFSKAEEEFRKVIYLDPATPSAYFALGTLLFKKGRYKEAKHHLLSAINLLEKGEGRRELFSDEIDRDILCQACKRYLERSDGEQR
jgi:chemotaxis protein methyltransferase CheR